MAIVVLKNYMSMKVGSSLATRCPNRSDPYYLVAFYIKWVTTSWTYSMLPLHVLLAAEGAAVLGVLGDFHLLHGLTERSTIPEKIRNMNDAL